MQASLPTYYKNPIISKSNTHTITNINNNVNNAKKTSNFLKFLIHEMSNDPNRVWLSLQTTANHLLPKILRQLADHHKKYHDKLKMWTIDFLAYESIVILLHSDEYSNLIAVEELPRFLIKCCNYFINDMKEFMIKYSNQPLNLTNNMNNQLLPFQFEGVRFVVNRNGRGMIADEMGCGKVIFIYEIYFKIFSVFKFINLDYTSNCTFTTLSR